MLECLKEWEDRQPQQGTASRFEEQEPLTQTEKNELDKVWKDCWNQIERIGKYKSMPPSVSAKKTTRIVVREPGEE
jgi:hypothetical protein